MQRTPVLFAAMIYASGVVIASPTEQAEDTLHIQIAKIEKILIKGFESNDPEALRSSTCTLRRLMQLAPNYDWTDCIIPLMHVLNTEEHDPAARVMAAGILHELGTERGDFAISRNAQYSDDLRVRRYCSILAKARSLEKSRMLAISR
jgi:hypothetical protein